VKLTGKHLSINFQPSKNTLMKHFNKLEVWFVTGSQELYGEETLKQVAAHSQKIAASFNASDKISVQVKFKPVVKSTEEIYNICMEANNEKKCIGLITWMHTFSPAKCGSTG
jgi:L-arabinose isomerase